MEIDVPRDRNGEYEPQIVPKHQREWRGFDEKIISMYSLGLSTNAIQENLKEIYNVDVSPELISRVTDEVKGLVEEWRNRPLESFYPIMFFYALRTNTREEGHVVKKSVYLALAIGLDDQKEVANLKFEGCGKSKTKAHRTLVRVLDGNIERAEK